MSSPFSGPKADDPALVIEGWERWNWGALRIFAIVHMAFTISYIALVKSGKLAVSDSIQEDIWNQWMPFAEGFLPEFLQVGFWVSISAMVLAWVLILVKKPFGLLLFTIVVAYWYGTQFVPVDKASSWLKQILVHMSILCQGGIIGLFIVGLAKKRAVQ